MKILVTGARGQLGCEIVKCFERGYTELGKPEILEEKNELAKLDIDELDISDLGALLSLFEKERFDAVINCAAFTNVNLCETERDTAFKANAICPRIYYSIS